MYSVKYMAKGVNKVLDPVTVVCRVVVEVKVSVVVVDERVVVAIVGPGTSVLVSPITG